MSLYRGLFFARHQQAPVEGMARDNAWPGTLMVAGLLFLVVSFWSVGERTLITYSLLLRWFAFLAFAGNLMPYRASGLRLGMERLEWFLFNLLAVGPILLCTALWINYMGHGPERHYPIRAVDRMVRMKQYWVENDSLPISIMLPNGPRANMDPSELVRPDQFAGRVISVADGSLGLVVLTRP